MAANLETGQQVSSIDFWRGADRLLQADGLLVKAAVRVMELKKAFAVQAAQQRAAANAARMYASPNPCACAVVVAIWTGRHARALRRALRLEARSSPADSTQLSKSSRPGSTRRRPCRGWPRTPPWT